jgi:hypothetical protein
MPGRVRKRRLDEKEKTTVEPQAEQAAESGKDHPNNERAAGNRDDPGRSTSGYHGATSDVTNREPVATSFLEELAWIESLASPTYVAYLCQMRYFDNPARQRYLHAMQRWRTDPAYRQHVSQPVALFFLEQLCSAEFREALRYPDVAALCESQVNLFRREYAHLLTDNQNNKQK